MYFCNTCGTYHVCAKCVAWKKKQAEKRKEFFKKRALQGLHYRPFKDLPKLWAEHCAK